MTAAGARPSSLRNGGGFILLEVLVALALLGIGIVSVLSSVQSSLALARESETRYRASLLLQQKLTEITNDPELGVDNMEMFGSSADSLFKWEISQEPWQNLALEAQLSGRDSEAVPDPGLSQTTVTVSWQSGTRTRRIQASELVPGTTELEIEP